MGSEVTEALWSWGKLDLETNTEQEEGTARVNDN